MQKHLPDWPTKFLHRINLTEGLQDNHFVNMFYGKYYDNNGYFNIFQGYFGSRLRE